MAQTEVLAGITEIEGFEVRSIIGNDAGGDAKDVVKATVASWKALALVAFWLETLSVKLTQEASSTHS